MAFSIFPHILLYYQTKEWDFYFPSFLPTKYLVNKKYSSFIFLPPCLFFHLPISSYLSTVHAPLKWWQLKFLMVLHI